MNISIPDQRRVLNTYDHDKQSLVHAEELAELTQALSKMRRRPTGYDSLELLDNLIEEIADSLICIEQMMVMYGISPMEIQTVVNTKCLRQEERMNRESSKKQKSWEVHHEPD